MLRSLFSVGSFTLMSRVLGLVRDMLVASYLGSSMYSQAFLAAMRLPNMFRRIFGEGAFNSAFVPLFNRELTDHGVEEARSFASNTFCWLGMVLTLATAVIIPGMPWFAKILVAGFEPEKYAITVAYSRVMFSYLLCMALSAHLSGVLNSLGKFLLPAFAPVLLNVLMLIVLAVIVPLAHLSGNLYQVGLWLSCAVCAAGFAQLGMLWWACHRQGMTIRPSVPKMTPRVKRLLVIMGPAVVTAGVQQINATIGTQIASMQDHAVSFLGMADRLYQLPNGLIGVAFGVVLLPQITRLVRAGKEAEASKSMREGIAFAMLLTLPAAAALIAAGDEFVSVLFQRGRWTAADSHATGLAVAAYGFGLPAFVLTKVLLPGYFARENTRTPLKLALITVSVDVTCAVGLYFVFRQWGIGHFGVALATSIASWVNVGLLARGLRGFLQVDAQLLGRLLRTFISAALMGALLWFGTQWLAGWFAGGEWQRLTATAIVVTLGGILYAVLTLVTRATSIAELKAGFRRG
ncbi:putative peptidoglycan lipid II flippase [Haloferula luteola]|uniref:Probable lipid II flippase MurJ n=1 Tax=Haloferula luteola TaxID=595692 RepID=A0A840V8W3_9BACT|nr:murein biosynthesis integral membrane protein MurJ [Haloferula luteola]MBB5353496.1 putative peptidoglycan lipid II flippase [Haloferula luteola]